MRLLLFDTETNGLPVKMYESFYKTENWPRILQIAWQILVLSEDGESFVATEHENFYITPDPAMTWDSEAAAIHGITREMLETQGRPLAEALAAFRAAASSTDVWIAHNIAFDAPVVMAEYVRLGGGGGGSSSGEIDLSWLPPVQYCTCDGTRAFCKLPTIYATPRNPYKRPKLSELHTVLFGGPGIYAAHNAAGDVACLSACVQELLRRRLVPLDAWRHVAAGRR
jgi:DNA polymerase III epsilon subunit-like protein